MPQNYRGKKPITKERSMETESKTVKPLELLVTPDSSTAYAVNSTLVDVGGTAQAINMAVRKIPVSIQDYLFNSSSTSINPLIDDELQEIIDSFATSRGYVTDVTVAKVRSYLAASTEYLAGLLWLFKAQNAKNLKGYDGFELGTILGLRPYELVSADDIADYIVNNNSNPVFNHGKIDDAVVSINNVNWSTMLSGLAYARMSGPQFASIVGIFGVDYLTNPEGTNVVYQFVPSAMVQNNPALDILNGYRTTMETLRQADADLADIMEFIGFSSSYAIGLDFTRDQRGLTPSIVEDAEFDMLKVNSRIDLGGIQANDSDALGLYVESHGTATFADFDKDKQIPASHILKYKLFDAWGATAATSAVNEHFVTYIWESTSPTTDVQAFFPPLGRFLIVDPIDANMTIRLRTVQVSTQYAGGAQSPFIVSGTFTQLAPGGAAGYGNVAIDVVVESFNTFAFDVEGMKFYRLAKLAEMALNGVEYRQALQSLTNAIRPISVTKQS